MCLQHFTGTLDNWDPAVTDAFALGREVILFENAGVGRSTGKVPDTIAGMARHVLAFAKASAWPGSICWDSRSAAWSRSRSHSSARPWCAGCCSSGPPGGRRRHHAPRKAELQRILSDPKLEGAQVLVKLFFAPSETSQAAGAAFACRLSERKEDREPISGPNVAAGTAGRLPRVGAHRRRALSQAALHHAALPGRERRARRHDTDQQLIRAGGAAAQRNVAGLCGCGSWLAVSVPRVVRGARVAVPRLVIVLMDDAIVDRSP